MINPALLSSLKARHKDQTGKDYWKYTYPEWSPAQMDFLECKSKKMILEASRRCLAEGTDILTPHGPVPIERIKIGDVVYGHNEDGSVSETYVKEVFDNGVQEVVSLCNGKREVVAATENHVFLCKKDGREKGKTFEVPVSTIVEKKGYYKIIRHSVKIPCGDIYVPEAYALGALLGDGCSRETSKKYICISGDDEPIVQKVQQQILSTGSYKKNSQYNYTWSIEKDELPQRYLEWCEGRYAHEKIVDLEDVKTWDRESCLQFLAGLIDTDGSVRCGDKVLTISVSMQAKSVIDAAYYVIYQLTGRKPSTTLDNRSKYVNGPVHEVLVRDNRTARKLLKELDPYLQCNRKKYKTCYDALLENNSAKDSIGVKEKGKRVVRTYDIHVANTTNLYLLAEVGIVTHNCGKTVAGIERMLRTVNTPKKVNGEDVYGGYVYIAPTKADAKAIIWDELKNMCRRRGLSFQSHEVDLTIKFPMGGFIHLEGAGLADSATKARGKKSSKKR